MGRSWPVTLVQDWAHFSAIVTGRLDVFTSIWAGSPPGLCLLGVTECWGWGSEWTIQPLFLFLCRQGSVRLQLHSWRHDWQGFSFPLVLWLETFDFLRAGEDAVGLINLQSLTNLKKNFLHLSSVSFVFHNSCCCLYLFPLQASRWVCHMTPSHSNSLTTPLQESLSRPKNLVMFSP